MLHQFAFQAMGTECVIDLGGTDCDIARRVASLAVHEILRIESCYSRYREDSQLAAINRVAKSGGSIDVDIETASLLDYAFAAYKKSGGLFDISSGLLRQAWNFRSGQIAEQARIDELRPRIGLEKLVWKTPHLTFVVPGMELDFGGIGKEYATDRAAEICVANGIQHGMVNLGGDLRVIGPQPSGEPWQIAIRHPHQPLKIMATIGLTCGALATSGNYERCIELNGKRYSHILNPRTGWPVQGLSSVSVVADSCLVAGTISTIAMLMEQAGVDWLRRIGNDHCCMDDLGNLTGIFEAGACPQKVA